MRERRGSRWSEDDDLEAVGLVLVMGCALIGAWAFFIDYLLFIDHNNNKSFY
jgi:hypothetical protein